MNGLSYVLLFFLSRSEAARGGSSPKLKGGNLQSERQKYRVSQKKHPAFESLLVPEYISDDILRNLIR